MAETLLDLKEGDCVVIGKGGKLKIIVDENGVACLDMYKVIPVTPEDPRSSIAKLKRTLVDLVWTLVDFETPTS